MAIPTLRQAVESAIIAAAHVNAHQSVALALVACQRLGALGSGRWRSAARDLERIESDLATSFEQIEADIEQLAKQLDVAEDSLWAAGEAAALLDAFQEGALTWVDEGGHAERLLNDDLVFGVQVLDEPDAELQGKTLVFTWADPLQPVVWPWEGTWIASGEDQDLDLATADAVVVTDATLGAVTKLLGIQPEMAERALLELAEALTRRALLGDDEDADEDEESEVSAEAGEGNSTNGHII